MFLIALLDYSQVTSICLKRPRILAFLKLKNMAQSRHVCLQVNRTRTVDHKLMSSVTPHAAFIETAYAVDIQCTHKRIVQFQELTRNLFLTFHGHNVHRQQR
jgi:hypothetical protein